MAENLAGASSTLKMFRLRRPKTLWVQVLIKSTFSVLVSNAKTRMNTLVFVWDARIDVLS